MLGGNIGGHYQCSGFHVLEEHGFVVHHVLLGADEGHDGPGDRTWRREYGGIPLAEEPVRLFVMKTKQQGPVG